MVRVYIMCFGLLVFYGDLGFIRVCVVDPKAHMLYGHGPVASCFGGLCF
jgi:hypothetical protein